MNTTRANELTIIYNSARDGVSNALRLADSLPGYSIKAIDVLQHSLTEAQLAELAAKAGCTIGELIDSGNPANAQSGDDLALMDPYSTLTMMVQNPSSIRTPIVVMGTRAFVVGESYELMKEEIGIRENRVSEQK